MISHFARSSKTSFSSCKHTGKLVGRIKSAVRHPFSGKWSGLLLFRRNNLSHKTGSRLQLIFPIYGNDKSLVTQKVCLCVRCV